MALAAAVLVAAEASAAPSKDGGVRPGRTRPLRSRTPNSPPGHRPDGDRHLIIRTWRPVAVERHPHRGDARPRATGGARLSGPVEVAAALAPHAPGQLTSPSAAPA